MFPFFGILSLCFILLKVILRFGKTVLLTLYSGWRIGRSTWGSGFSLLELFWQLILKTITVARNFQLQFLFLNLIAVSYESSQTEFWKGGCQRVYKWYVIKAKINMWRVNFTANDWVFHASQQVNKNHSSTFHIWCLIFHTYKLKFTL